MYFDNSFKKKETPTKIKDKLFLGNALDSDNLEKLQKLGIKYILIAGNNLKANFPEVFKKNNFPLIQHFTYKNFAINDHQFEEINIYFEESYNFIKEGIEAGGCFVHW